MEVEEDNSFLRSNFRVGDEDDDDVSDNGSKNLNFETRSTAEEFELIFLGWMDYLRSRSKLDIMGQSEAQMDLFLHSGCREEPNGKIDPNGVVGSPRTSRFLSEAGKGSSSPTSLSPTAIEEGNDALTPVSTLRALTKLVSYSSDDDTFYVSVDVASPFGSASLNGEGWVDSSQSLPHARRRRR